jgi:nucleotide-binding universal stress UspA family protein
MLAINRILCPVDFSPPSRRALDYAIGIARWYGAKITALHVSPIDVPVGEITPWGPGPTVQTTGLGAQALREMLARFVAAEAGQGVEIDTKVAEGPVADEIATHSRLHDADLIVIGTHGRSGFRRLILGSVTETVLRTASCPVMTVPPAAPEAVPMAAGLFKKILCPTDFSPASEHSVRWGLAFAQEADAELLLLHAFEHTVGVEDESFPRSALAAYRRDYQAWAVRRLHDQVPESAKNWCRVTELTRVGSAHREILQAAAEHACDLIVLGVGRHRDLADRIFGSTTQQVVRAAACPVLSVGES